MGVVPFLAWLEGNQKQNPVRAFCCCCCFFWGGSPYLVFRHTHNLSTQCRPTATNLAIISQPLSLASVPEESASRIELQWQQVASKKPNEDVVKAGHIV